MNGPTGSLIKGSIFDCNKNSLEKALKRYDPRLYIKWNPRKREGYGVWEIRIRPRLKTLVRHDENFCSLEWRESDLIHHVLDVPILSYRILDKIYEMDSYRSANYGKDLDDQLDKAEDDIDRRRLEEMRLRIRDDKKYVREWQELVRSGYNPMWFLK